jgi:sec-independent protein translocase protein TatA
MLQTPELILIMFIVMLLFGARKLPDLARSMGSAVKEFQNASKDPLNVVDKNLPETKEFHAIVEAAKKLKIETEGKSIQAIAEELVKITEKK